ncbi:MAG: nucleoside-diphosphate kinase [Candidatus Micrarchaeota archaeon]|nr:nucleoside-diphosphate kinase [Candidatus Micrarchaeota archaeon]
MQRTLVLVKPDGVYRALIGKVISQIEDTGLRVIAMKMVWADRKIAAVHYADDPEWYKATGAKTLQNYKDRGVKTNKTAEQLARGVREMLIKFISSGPVVAMVVEGESAISVTRKLVGATEPRKAEPYTIRGRYCSDSYEAANELQRPILNIVHASEDTKTADREIELWFKKTEIFDYKRADEKFV